MDSIFLMFIVMAFVAVVLVFEGVYQTLFAGRSKEARRIRQRLAQLNAVTGSTELRLLREEERIRAGEFARWLMEREWGRRLSRYVTQAGGEAHAADLLLLSGALLLASLLLCLLMRQSPAAGLLSGGVLASLPWLTVIWGRERRLQRMEAQFPDALDLIARAMRAGHALTTAIKMCGEEVQVPLGPELRRLSDEITLGIPFDDALDSLVERVPLSDVSFLAVAMSVQRETGGNLAELLDKLATLMRDRARLKGDVRIKTAQGRLSAWILVVLPFFMAGLMTLLNKDATMRLWQEPAARTALWWVLGLMGLGVFWITRIVRVKT